VKAKEKNMSKFQGGIAVAGFKIPGRVINLDQARVRHGDKADHMVRMLAVGDPLADGVIVEMDALGKEGRRILNAALADGLESLSERPPAITALLQQLETMPEWVDRDTLGRGEVATLSVSPFWYALCAIPSALVHTYASPAIARLLTQTGRLTTMAPRRLAETGMWRGRPQCPVGCCAEHPDTKPPSRYDCCTHACDPMPSNMGATQPSGAFRSARWMWPAPGWTSP